MANIITTLALEMSENWYVSKKLNSIGRVGENTVTKLTIEPTEILDNVTYELEIMSADGSKNVAELTVDGTELYLILTANMLTTSGITKMQVRATFEDGSIKKSNIFELKVNRSISATEHYEEYAVTIFDQLVAECRDIIEGAESYAVRAETAAVNAEAYEQSASASAEAASAAATTATTASTAAVNAATSAENSATSAHTSAETATTAANSASASANTAQTSAQTATSASTAAQSASETAQTASTTATTAATNAETAANTATTAANNASTSATSAATSASNAAISETNASTSAANASTSETNAASSATSAANSATSASTSATNAANSAVAAATSASNAAVSATNASTSETNASASAAEAAETAESIAVSVAQINENTYRINDLEAIIAGYQQADLPTGSVATITDGTALLMPSLKIGIEPVQDLHGYDHPWAGGAGKNLLNYDEWKKVNVSNGTAIFENNGITLTATNNDCFTQYIDWSDNKKIYVSEGETITLSWTESTNADGRVYIFPNGIGIETYRVNNSVSKQLTYTVASGVTFVTFRFGVSIAGNTISYENIQIEKGSTATSYEPYSNICPISGWTAANVSVSGVNVWDEEWELGGLSSSTGEKTNSTTTIRSKNFVPVKSDSRLYIHVGLNANLEILFYEEDKSYISGSGIIANNAVVVVPNNAKFLLFRTSVTYGTVYLNDISINYPSTDKEYHTHNGQTYTVQFTDGDNPLTVYGGTLDVVSGELTVTDGYIASYSGETLLSTWISDRDVYAEGTTPTTGAEVVYELATPTTYQLTPTQVRTLVGTNNIWADTGDIIEGKYFKSLS